MDLDVSAWVPEHVLRVCFKVEDPTRPPLTAELMVRAHGEDRLDLGDVRLTAERPILEGRIVDRFGRPVCGAEVFAAKCSVISGRNGRFAVSSNPDGPTTAVQVFPFGKPARETPNQSFLLVPGIVTTCELDCDFFAARWSIEGFFEAAKDDRERHAFDDLYLGDRRATILDSGRLYLDGIAPPRAIVIRNGTRRGVARRRGR